MIWIIPTAAVVIGVIIVAFKKKTWESSEFNRRLEEESQQRKMSDKQVRFKDSDGRQIKISPSHGLQVEDGEGTIIHDTPDCVIASDMVYGGHIYWKDITSFVVTMTLEYTDTQTTRSVTGSTTNTDISSVLPSDLTNPRGVLAHVVNFWYFSPNKVQDSTSAIVTSRYAINYNEAPATHNRLLTGRRMFSATMTSAIDEYDSCQTVIPVTWNNGTPYITTNVYISFNGMASNNALYRGKCSIAVLGFLV